MGVNGLLTDVRWEWTGTEVVTGLLAGTTVLPVLDPEAITAGENVWIASSGPYQIVSADVDAETLTISPGLQFDIDTGTEVATDIGGQPGRAWVCEVVLADSDTPIEVPLTVHDLAVMPEGVYDPPVGIVLSDDLERVENLPGSLPVISGEYIPPESLPIPQAGNKVYRQDDPPWPDGTDGMTDNDLWYDTNAVTPDGTITILPFTWDATNKIWVDASDPRVNLIEDPGSLVVGNVSLDQMQQVVINNYETATSAQSLASTADGRVSMSDYDPTPADTTYYATDSKGDLIHSTSFVIDTVQLTSGLATLTLDPLGGLFTVSDGDWIIVTKCGAPFDGEWQVSSHTTAEPYTVTYRIAGQPDVPLTDLDPNGIGFNSLLQQRVPGSVWYTRTRTRKNFCDNPSFEVDTAGWATSQAGLVRVPAGLTPDDVIAGHFVGEVTNSGVAGDHRAEWTGGTPGLPVTPGQSWASTCFALAVSGVNTGCYGSMRFYDAADAPIPGSEAFGPLVDLATNDWRELKIATIVPAGAVKAGPIILHNPNPGAVWRIDGGLAEQADYTGRYFDGDTPDYGSWLGAPDQSASQLLGGKIISVWELYNGAWVQMDFTGTTTYNADASDLLTGTLANARLGNNSITQEKLKTNSVRVSDAVTAGMFVNIWNNNGLFFVRPANASDVTRAAHGFVLSSAAAGQDVPVYTTGYNPMCSGLTPGVQFLSATADGQVTDVVQNAVGRIVQRVGVASDATTCHFEPQQPVLLTA